MAAILIIDDEGDFRELVKEVLEKVGYDVFEAGDGDEGIRQFKERPIDIVLTDLYMPGKGGPETILEIRKIRPDTKIIALSGGGALSLESSLSIAKFRGADHALAKPVSLDKLVSLVGELISEIDRDDSTD